MISIKSIKNPLKVIICPLCVHYCHLSIFFVHYLKLSIFCPLFSIFFIFFIFLLEFLKKSSAKFKNPVRHLFIPICKLNKQKYDNFLSIPHLKFNTRRKKFMKEIHVEKAYWRYTQWSYRPLSCLLFDTAEYEIVPNQCGTIPSYEGIWKHPVGKNTLIWTLKYQRTPVIKYLN